MVKAPNFPVPIYNPVEIANYALIRYNDLIDKSNKLHSKFNPMMDINNHIYWLIDHGVNKEGMLFWEYDYPVELHDCIPPWKSGMAQGLILSLLVRANFLTNDPKYSNCASMVANSMKTKIDSGGFLFEDPYGDYWYQEYMGDCGYVLNGFIFGLWGVYDYYLYSGDLNYKIIFDRCMSTLRKNLSSYDVRFMKFNWSRYELSNKYLADLYYHKLHIELLRELYLITEEPYLLTYINKWEMSLRQPILAFIDRHELINNPYAKSSLLLLRRIGHRIRKH